MAGFKTHITTSTIIGVGYGAAGYWAGAPLASCMLAGGLCSVSGMLPDLDSDSGIPLRESVNFAAAIIPMLMIDRFQHMGLSHESMALAGGLIYVAIRFGVAEIFKRYTVHRGMWHSIPAAFIAGLLAFLICSCEDINLRLFKSGGVLLGFLTHLILDEIWSIDLFKGRLKKSFGTAMKLWSRRSLWANVSTYAKLLLLIGAAVGDPFLMDKLGYHDTEIHHTAKEIVNQTIKQGEQAIQQSENLLR